MKKLDFCKLWRNILPGNAYLSMRRRNAAGTIFKTMPRFLLFFTALAALATAACGHAERRSFGPLQHESQSVELSAFEKSKAERLNLDLRMSAGELQLKGGAVQLMEADFTFQDPQMKPIVRFTPGALHSELSIEEPHVITTSGRYEWSLRLRDGIPLDLTTNLGAGNVDMKLGTLALRNVEIHMGVGNLDLDLRGTPQQHDTPPHDYDVQVKGGVGNATIYLPAHVNIVANAKGGVGNISARGLEKHNGQWFSKGAADAKVNVHLDIKGGVGNIDLIAE